MRGRNHQKLLILLTVIAFGMFGFGFALVPIYNSLCKALNINGKTNPEAIAYDPKTSIKTDREIIVEFVATNNSAVPWEFHPTIKKIKTHPGEIARLSIYAANQSNHQMTVQAIPSVTP